MQPIKKLKCDAELQVNPDFMTTKYQISQGFSHRNSSSLLYDSSHSKTEMNPKPLQKTLYYFTRHPKEVLKLPALGKNFTTAKLSNNEVIELAGPKPVLTLNEVLSQNVIDTLKEKPKKNKGKGHNKSRSVNISPILEAEIYKRTNPKVHVSNFQSPINKIKYEMVEGLNQIIHCSEIQDENEKNATAEKVQKAIYVLEKIAYEKSLFGEYLLDVIDVVKKGIFSDPDSFFKIFPIDFVDRIFIEI